MTDVSAIIEAMARAMRDPETGMHLPATQVRAALAALNLTEAQAAALADGSAVVVPVELTREMGKAAYEAHNHSPTSASDIWRNLGAVYTAMLKARPQ